ncbi:uncharacterized protein LOC114286266 isoform X6 [Camellia sinensis]|uniref:uncharacterized protein LOC114286266 isoform X6 n=1 Tax=Camellia sinensis TaxID=4442 RepID=UPI0010365CFA|nr:uncharacterized protein LOC114286266 isoform X6 [Camellia sinensis]
MHPLIDLIAHLTVSHSLVLHLHRSTLSHRKIGRSTDSRIAPIDLTGLGRIAGILSLEVEDGNTTLDSLQHVGSELAMHVVATKPLFLRKDLVSSDALENELAEIDGGLLGPIGPLGFGIYDDLLGPPIDGVYPGLLVVPISPPELEKIMKNWALSEASEDNRFDEIE